MKQTRWFPLIVLLCLLSLADSSVRAQTGGTLGYGARVYGMITADTPTVTYSLSGQQGDYVVITAESWTGTLAVQLDLVAPNGVVLAHSQQNPLTDAPLDAQSAVFLPETGVYVLRLSGENNTVGDYLLVVLGRSPVQATPLLSGQALEVTLPQASLPLYFSFESNNCPTTLMVTNLNAEPTAAPFIVKVRDQRGQTVMRLWIGDQLEDWVTVTADSGQYEVEVATLDPVATGSLRLLVTCAGANPSCAAGDTAADSAVCAPCPAVEQLVPGDECPDLHLTAQQSPTAANWVTVGWDAFAGADGYAVYVTGLPEGGGEVYVTHSEWIAGNPTEFSWVLPDIGYTGFNFTLQVLVDGIVLCTQSVHVDLTIEMTGCPDLGLTAAMTDPAVRALSVGWDAELGADQFALDLYSVAGGSESYSGGLSLPGDRTSYTFDHFPPTLDAVRFVLWMTRGDLLCSDELTVTFSPNGDQSGGEACAVRAEREGVAARVGPGTARSIFTFLNPGIDYTVIGQAADEGGNLWWQVDKTQFAGHEAVISLWVAQAEVTALGDCADIPQGEIPDVIPFPDDEGEPGGSWLPCGSCDTCGHPAAECVTSPAGLCLWDPATCVGGSDPGDETSACYTVNVTIDMGTCFGGGSALLDTVPNCQGTQYLPGTLLQAHTLAVDAKCTVQSWTGCGVSGSGSSISFVPPGSCTLTAHMGY